MNKDTGEKRERCEKYEGVVKIRQTTAGDAELLFKWRNDPSTYAHFLNPRNVSWEEHVKWLDDSLKSSSRFLFIVESEEGLPIGNLRVDIENENVGEVYEISWAVAPEWRGRGVGKKMLGELLALPMLKGKRLKAVIKKNNIASLKMAEAFGFKKKKEKGEFEDWFLEN